MSKPSPPSAVALDHAALSNLLTALKTHAVAWFGSFVDEQYSQVVAASAAAAADELDRYGGAEALRSAISKATIAAASPDFPFLIEYDDDDNALPSLPSPFGYFDAMMREREVARSTRQRAPGSRIGASHRGVSGNVADGREEGKKDETTIDLTAGEDEKESSDANYMNLPAILAPPQGGAAGQAADIDKFLSGRMTTTSSPQKRKRTRKDFCRAEGCPKWSQSANRGYCARCYKVARGDASTAGKESETAAVGRAARKTDGESDSEESYRPPTDCNSEEDAVNATTATSGAEKKKKKTSQHCLTDGCPKFRASKCDGYCMRCFNSLHPGAAKEAAANARRKSAATSRRNREEEIAAADGEGKGRKVVPRIPPPTSAYCVTDGCPKFRASKCEGYCKRCHNALRPEARARKRKEKEKEEEKRPTLRRKTPTIEERVLRCHAFLEEHGHLDITAVPGKSGGFSEDEDEFRRWALKVRIEHGDLLEGWYDATISTDGSMDEEGGKRKNNWKRKKSKGLLMNQLEMLEEIGFKFETMEKDDDCGQASTADAAAADLAAEALTTEKDDDSGQASTVDAAAADLATEASTTEKEATPCSATGEAGSASDGKMSAAPAGKTPSASQSRIIFDMRLDQCREFKAEKGHLNIGHKFKKSSGLSEWASRMRSLYARRLEEGGAKDKTPSEGGDGPPPPPLTTGQREKLKELESLGFAFDGVFDVNAQKLLAYKARNGHTKVPIEYAPDTALGYWADKCRREHNRMGRGEKSTYLTLDRLRKLGSIGFSFSSRPKQSEIPFDVRLAQLRAYREEHGKDPMTSHPELGNWVSRMRLFYNRKMDGKHPHHMPDDREQKLRDVGFVFRVGLRPDARAAAAQLAGMKRSFDDYLQEFVRWKEKHGHPYVPTVCEGEDKRLGLWVAKQRMRYRSLRTGVKNSGYGTATADQALRLANAGFAFDASNIRRTPKDVASPEGADEEDPDDGEEGVGAHEDGVEGVGADLSHWGSYDREHEAVYQYDQNC